MTSHLNNYLHRNLTHEMIPQQHTCPRARLPSGYGFGGHFGSQAANDFGSSGKSCS